VQVRGGFAGQDARWQRICDPWVQDELSGNPRLALSFSANNGNTDQGYAAPSLNRDALLHILIAPFVNLMRYDLIA
jgi:hypothetical protein